MTDFTLSRVQDALSSHYRELIFLTKEVCPATLIDALQSHLPHVPPSEWSSRLERGGTYVNGDVVLENVKLPAPCRIEYYEPKDPNDDQRLNEIARDLHKLIIHQDEDLLVIYKPRGIATLPTREQRFLNLKTFLLSFLKKSRGSEVLHMPSRVDTSVQGLVIVSTSVWMHARLQRAFEDRRAKKTYMLTSDHAVPWTDLSATRGIERDPRHPVLRQAVDGGGKPSRTDFALKGTTSDSGKTLSLIEARPITGRTHQIRVHASSYGFPIVGDNFYGGMPAPELHLVSFRLELIDPRGGKLLQFEAPAELLPQWLSKSA